MLENADQEIGKESGRRNPEPAFWISFGIAGMALVAVGLFRFPGAGDRAYCITTIFVGVAVAALPWISSFRVKGLFEIKRAVERAKEETRDHMERTSTRIDNKLDAVQVELRANFSNLQTQINQQTLMASFNPTLNIYQSQKEEKEDAQRQASRVKAVPQDAGRAEQERQLENYAREYEYLRLMPAGYQRTSRMTMVVDKVKAFASQARLSDPNTADELFKKDSDGERLVALAIMQAKPDSSYFDNSLEAIANSRSAFEQYQSLLAMERMVTLLNSDQKRILAGVLEDQCSGGPGKYITPDSDRWLIRTRILSAIQQ